MLQFALRALRQQRLLARVPLGVLVYGDEGEECQHSEGAIRRAAQQAGEVLVLRPGTADGKVITTRRGQRRYRFKVEGPAKRPGQPTKKPEVLGWTLKCLEDFAALGSRKNRVSISPSDLTARSFPTLLPHRVEARLVMTYGEAKAADAAEERMRIVLGRDCHRWELDIISDRPAMPKRKTLDALTRLSKVAERWELPFDEDASVSASVAGLVPEEVPVICGLGPVTHDIYSPHEAVQRLSLLQRTLLLAQFLVEQARAVE
jgi:D-alanine-D-alanine ligase